MMLVFKADCRETEKLFPIEAVAVKVGFLRIKNVVRDNVLATHLLRQKLIG